MNKTELMNTVTRSLNKFGLTIKKHSPEILVTAGVVGGVASAVMACKATTNLDIILETHREKVDKHHNAFEHPETLPAPYTEDMYKKDLTIVHTQTAVNVVKLYAPAVALGTLSITAILAGYGILRKRNVALAAAYTAVDKSFKEYRGRVIDRFGEALDKELRYNIKNKEVEEIIVNEDGTETVVKENVAVADLSGCSDYAKFFDEGCAAWTKDPEYNLMFLKDQQRYANDLLKQKGFLFLNDVYELLGIDRTRAGQVVGWIYDEKNPIGDNYIDFGIYDIHRKANRSFVNGYERSILLDFNVDGDILSKF